MKILSIKLANGGVEIYCPLDKILQCFYTIPPTPVVVDNPPPINVICYELIDVVTVNGGSIGAMRELKALTDYPFKDIKIIIDNIRYNRSTWIVPEEFTDKLINMRTQFKYLVFGNL